MRSLAPSPPRAYTHQRGTLGRGPAGTKGSSTPMGSVTQWIRGLKAGDAAAVQKLWEGYFGRLVRLARGKLQAVPRW